MVFLIQNTQNCDTKAVHLSITALLTGRAEENPPQCITVVFSGLRIFSLSDELAGVGSEKTPDQHHLRVVCRRSLGVRLRSYIVPTGRPLESCEKE